MATKLYFGSLSYDTTDEGLKNACAPHGTVVSSTIIMDRASGRSKGFGFVEMSSQEEAQKVIAALNDTELDGRSIKVNEARPLEPRQ